MQPTLNAVSSCTAPPSPRSSRSTRAPSSRLSRSRSRSTSGSIGGMVGAGAGAGRAEGGGGSGCGFPLRRILSCRLLATKWVRSPCRLTVPSSSRALEMVALRPPPAPGSGPPGGAVPPDPQPLHAPLSPSKLRLSWRRPANGRPPFPASRSSSSSSSSGFIPLFPRAPPCAQPPRVRFAPEDTETGRLSGRGLVQEASRESRATPAPGGVPRGPGVS
uniref:Uncharacterized protein n=1 Tax=Monodelphis domestica TaxID=13616 RepID=A0A5F8GTN1_MONDO